MLTITPSESDVYTAIVALLGVVMPAGDAVFNGEIVGGVLTASNVVSIASPNTPASLSVGDEILGLYVAPGTVVAALGANAGEYVVSPEQDVQPTTMATGVPALQTQLNRVAEPRAADFAMMTIVTQPRLSTNGQNAADVVFTGSIDETTLTVDDVEFGEIEVGAALFGQGVALGTSVRAKVSDTVFQVAPSQALASTRMAAGRMSEKQTAMVGVQVDLHGPNSSDFAAALTIMFTTDAAIAALGSVSGAISPLYADAPRQMPFLNGEDQIEGRWVVTAQLQVDYTVSLSQQYADVLALDVVSVEATYPPT